MLIVNRNPMVWLAGLAVSLIIFLIIYFAVIKPDNNSANKAINSSEKQAQQVLQSAQKQVNAATKGSGSAGTAANAATSKAAKLAACVTKAGTDVGKIQTCQASFGS
jgi:flagellar biosynthesis/type III secretory pathway M-ring protein FliF/YscJ